MSLVDSEAYQKMWDDFGKSKAEGYVESKFIPRNAVGFRNCLREQMLLNMVNLQKEDRILDVGCAAGRQSLLMAEKTKEVVGIDISADFIRKAKVCAQKKGFNNVIFQRGSIENLPFQDSSFDKIFCAEVLEHVVDVDVAMRELTRVLKPCGKLVISVPNENGDATVWARIKNAVTRKKFSPLAEYSLDEVIKHGDAHLRKFNTKTLKKLLREYGIEADIMKGCGYSDWPFFDKIIYRVFKWEFIRKFLLRIEFALSNLIFLKTFSRHLLCRAVKKEYKARG